MLGVRSQQYKNWQSLRRLLTARLAETSDADVRFGWWSKAVIVRGAILSKHVDFVLYTYGRQPTVVNSWLQSVASQRG